VKIHSGVAPGSNTTSAVAPDPVGKGAVVGIAVAASLGLLPWLGISMFADEGATLYSAHLSWSNLWAQSQHVDLVLLPYYVVVHFWLMVSGSIAWVRALSLLAYSGTIVVVGWTGLRIAGRWCGIIAAVLTATSTVVVEKSLNARPYELSTLLVALCAVLLFKWLDDSRARWLWAFSIVALLAAAMQLFSLLAPTSMLACVLVVRPALIAQRLRALLAPIALLAVASGAWVVACIREVGQVNWIANDSTESRLLAEVRGPVIGQYYDLVVFVIVVLAVAKLAVIWDRDVRDTVVEGVSRDRDILALMIGWVVIPTVVLSVASFAHPIYSVRYVSASAPGAALLAAFICVRAFPRTLDPSHASDQTAHSKLWSRRMATFSAAAAAVLVIGYLGSASALQEDLESPARYAAQHVKSGDVVAIPDHAITSVVQYYVASDKRHIRLWPQLGVRQRYVEGFDLSLHPFSAGGFPRRVWLVDDGSAPGVTRFERVLAQDGYVLQEIRQFNGSTLLLFYFTLPTTAVLVPASGATLSGTAALAASASSYGFGITKVQFVLSGGSYSKTVIPTTPAYSQLSRWNTTSIANGTYTLQSVATDGAGRSSYSPAITIKVDN
jgi:4-amino-4-deoxy-L-arabinose transferase-like glycosyltransferase